MLFCRTHQTNLILRSSHCFFLFFPFIRALQNILLSAMSNTLAAVAILFVLCCHQVTSECYRNPCRPKPPISDANIMDAESAIQLPRRSAEMYWVNRAMPNKFRKYRTYSRRSVSRWKRLYPLPGVLQSMAPDEKKRYSQQLKLRLAQLTQQWYPLWSSISPRLLHVAHQIVLHTQSLSFSNFWALLFQNILCFAFLSSFRRVFPIENSLFDSSDFFDFFDFKMETIQINVMRLFYSFSE